MDGCTNRKAKSRRMDRLLISIMSVKGDIEGSLEFAVSESEAITTHKRLLQFMFITMNNGQVIVDSSETWNLRA